MSFTSPTIRRAVAFAASGLIFAGLALPANAKDVESRPTKAEASASQSADASERGKKYCVREALTGSRMERKVCRTEREWANEGVDISRK